MKLETKKKQSKESNYGCHNICSCQKKYCIYCQSGSGCCLCLNKRFRCPSYRKYRNEIVRRRRIEREEIRQQIEFIEVNNNYTKIPLFTNDNSKKISLLSNNFKLNAFRENN